MADFLSVLGNLGAGAQQGLMNGQQFQLRAQQIQQNQAALDEQKRQLAASAAAFSGLLGNQGNQGGAPAMPPTQQTGQPPMPGQASVPSHPQGQSLAGPQMPTGGQMPPGGSPYAQTQQMGAGGQDLSPQGQLSIIGTLARNIKAQNPNIDPATLLDAVKQQISLMGGLAATQKQQLVMATDQLRADVSRQNTQDRIQSQQQIAQGNQASRERIASQNNATRLQATQARIQDADQRLSQTEAAINARQDKSMAGRAQNKAMSERAAYLRTNLSQAKQKLSSAVGSGDQQAINSAQKSVDDAYRRILDFQQKAMSGSQNAQQTSSPPPVSQRGPAPASLHGKPIWPENGKWVYEDGTEAK